jgi:photosystem II stability/assembly factor-like uncharacterized protein
MVDASNGRAVNGDKIEHTTDGAQTFRIVTPPGVTHLDGLFFLDADRAWVISATLEQTNVVASILNYTSDGGATWRSTAMHPALTGDPVFVDSDHGWIETTVGVHNHTAIDRTLWHTADGGLTWLRVHESTYRLQIEPQIQQADCSPGFPAWISDTAGLAGVSCPDGSNPRLQVTTDGGVDWRTISLPPLPALPGISLGTSVGPIHIDRHGDLVTMVSRCIGPDGMSCRNYGELYSSSDGGVHWTTGSLVWGAGEILVVDAEHVWLPDACATDQCSSPLLFTTADSGSTWRSFQLPQELWPNMHGSQIFSVATPLEAFVVIANEFEPAPKYFRTTDGGQSFSQFSPRVVG